MMMNIDLERRNTVSLWVDNKSLSHRDAIEELARFDVGDEIRCVQKTNGGFDVSFASATAADDVHSLKTFQILGITTEVTRPGKQR